MHKCKIMNKIWTMFNNVMFERMFATIEAVTN